MVSPGSQPCEFPVYFGADSPNVCPAVFFPIGPRGDRRQGNFLGHLRRFSPAPVGSSVFVVVWDLGKVQEPFFGPV
eukprot:6583051-Heterocapsa_arctica.AAC.1